LVLYGETLRVPLPFVVRRELDG